MVVFQSDHLWRKSRGWFNSKGLWRSELQFFRKVGPTPPGWRGGKRQESFPPRGVSVWITVTNSPRLTELPSGPSRCPSSDCVFYPLGSPDNTISGGWLDPGAVVGQQQFPPDVCCKSPPCSLQTPLRTEVMSLSLNLVPGLKLLTDILNQITCLHTWIATYSPDSSREN